MTWNRSHVWRTETSLWENAVSVAPHYAGPRLALGLAYQREGRFDEAREQYDKTLSISAGSELEPPYMFAVGFNLSKIMTLEGNIGSAMVLLDNLEGRFPEQHETIRHQRAMLLRRSGLSCHILESLQLPCVEL